MYQNRYFGNDPTTKPMTATQGMENKRYSGNPLLRQVDEELRRLRSQFDKAVGSSAANPTYASTTQNNSSNISNHNFSPILNTPSRIQKVEEPSRSNYLIENSQQSSFAVGRQNYHKDSHKYGIPETINETTQNIGNYAYQGNTGALNTPNTTGLGTQTSQYQNPASIASTLQKGAVTTKTTPSNGSFEFKSPKNLTNSGRYTESPTQNQSQPSAPSQQPVISSQNNLNPTNIPIIQVSNNETFKLPATKPEVVKISNPQSQTIRINSPPKIRSGPSPAQVLRAQEEAKRLAEMQHIQRQRQLAQQYQEETTRIREQRQRATKQRRQKQERDASISKSQLGNYVTNINDKNKKISELESKINQMQYQITNAQNQTKRCKLQIDSLKNSHKSQLEVANVTIVNLKKQIDLLNRDKERRNLDLENKINKVNFSYEEVNATNNRLMREIEGLKRELERKGTSTEVSSTVFDDFKQKINEKTIKINDLERQLGDVSEQRNQLKKRVDQLLLQGYGVKKEFNLQKLEKQPGAFDEILKMNLQQNQTYKSNLAVKDEEIFRLEEVNRTLKGENERMKNEIEIEKLKRITEIKNIQTTMDIEIQVKQNEINSLNHVILALEEKLKFIVQQDRKKDNFMVTYLKGRAESAEEKQSVDEFFKQFELLSVNVNIAQCLKREQTEIQNLKNQIQNLYKERR